MTTKAARSRIVPISSRLLEQLKVLFEKAKGDSDSVFGISDNVRDVGGVLLYLSCLAFGMSHTTAG
jgi:hypothetical protein